MTEYEMKADMPPPEDILKAMRFMWGDLKAGRGGQQPSEFVKAADLTFAFDVLWRIESVVEGAPYPLYKAKV